MSEMGLIPIFHRWIQQGAAEGLLIDVADYAHVPDGPGIVLVSHEGHYGVELGDGRLGLRYSRKRALSGTLADRLATVLRIALRACRQLEQEPELEPPLQFPGDEVEVVLNDRLLAPNTDETMARFEPALSAVLSRMYDGSTWAVTRAADPREPFALTVKAAVQPGAGALLERLL